FNIGSAGLDTEELAKVLIHFARQGIINVPQSRAGTQLRNVEPGWHFCRFYRDFDQLLKLVAPYVVEGLRNGEGSFSVLPASVTSQAACDVLAKSLGDVGSYLASGQLELSSHPTWYLNEDGQLKSFEEITEALVRKQNQALARGFKFLRAAGDAGWVSGT